MRTILVINIISGKPCMHMSKISRGWVKVPLANIPSFWIIDRGTVEPVQHNMHSWAGNSQRLPVRFKNVILSSDSKTWFYHLGGYKPMRVATLPQPSTNQFLLNPTNAWAVGANLFACLQRSQQWKANKFAPTYPNGECTADGLSFSPANSGQPMTHRQHLPNTAGSHIGKVAFHLSHTHLMLDITAKAHQIWRLALTLQNDIQRNSASAQCQRAILISPDLKLDNASHNRTQKVERSVAFCGPSLWPC